MSRRSGLDIKKDILENLKEKEYSLRELDIKIRTNYITIRKHCEELSYFGLIELINHKKSPDTGRPYTTAKITDQGRKY